MFDTPNVTLVTKGNRPKVNKNNQDRQYKKGSHLLQKGGPKAEIAKKQKANGIGKKNITCVKCYNCGKKCHYALDYPESPKV